ncbi:DUF159-domain-containing protein [Meira miltonrushii]|uniref:DUF159-domain-containing protein n=1 Tax=Meira miltonrushii TaxID=1280837 RepID=A0A316V4W5_9BASI|nr:DUF159-domain-containing protein [Meira miltonrushii]PWN32570.1 DUF159-domain-containing protein [Meira miltonrushii]
MCGRFAQALPPRDYYDVVDDQLQGKRRPKEGDSGSGGENIKSGPQLQLHSQVGEQDYHPTYNVAPGVQVPIVRLEDPVPLTSSGKSGDQALLIQCMRWGLLPHHTTFIPRGVDAMRTINARDDAVLSGRSMWTPILRSGKRCIVFAQGFYEWLKKDEGAQKIAHFVGVQIPGNGRKDADGKQRGMMPMAGLWEKCTIDGKDVYSFTIITTDSNDQLNFLHDRMPVILPDERAMRIWLGIGEDVTQEEVRKLLRPYPAQLDCYPVPREVGKVGNDNANFILPVSMRKDGIQAAFGRAKQKDKEQQTPIKEESLSTEKATKEEEKGQQSATTETNAPIKEEVVSANKAAKEEDKDINNGTPSSKYSPEPFNPPLSPERPKGGYSTVDNPDPTPYRRRGQATPTKREHPSPGVGAGNSAKKRQLEESAKGTKDIRSFFSSK